MLTVSESHAWVLRTVSSASVLPPKRFSVERAHAVPSVPCPNWAFTPKVCTAEVSIAGLRLKLDDALPSGLVTTTGTANGPEGAPETVGTVTTSFVLVRLVIVAGWPFIVTLAPLSPVPVMVSESPDHAKAGEIFVIVVLVGAGVGGGVASGGSLMHGGPLQTACACGAAATSPATAASAASMPPRLMRIEDMVVS